MRWRFWGMLGAMVCLGQEVSAQNATPKDPARPPVNAVKWDSTVTIRPNEIQNTSTTNSSTLPVSATTQQETAESDRFNNNGNMEELSNSYMAGGEQVWGGLDYMLWWLSPNPISGPNLVTKGNWNNPAPGAVGQRGTSQAGPAPGIDYGTFSGGKLTLGGWLDSEQSVGLEFTGFLLEQRGWGQIYQGGALPANEIFTNPTKALLPYRGREVVGQWSTASSLKQSGVQLAPINNYQLAANLQMWSADINWLANWGRTETQSFDLLFGFRQMQVQEGLTVKGQSSYYDFPNSQYTTQTGTDSVTATNGFYGGQFGGKISEQFGRVRLDVVGKLALGGTLENVRFAGNNTVNTIAGSTTTEGYVYTQKSNIGLHTAKRFAVLPEILVKLGVPVTEHLNVGLGYNFLYLSSVARTGNQLDPYINAAANPAHPIANMSNNGIWAQGVMFSAEWKY